MADVVNGDVDEGGDVEDDDVETGVVRKERIVVAHCVDDVKVGPISD